MSQRGTQPGQPPIYLFASQFPVGKSKFSKAADRLDKTLNPFGSLIKEMRALWIVAAGNGNKIDEYEEISRKSIESPANLGDQENIVVVSACQDCYSDESCCRPQIGLNWINHWCT